MAANVYTLGVSEHYTQDGANADTATVDGDQTVWVYNAGSVDLWVQPYGVTAVAAADGTYRCPAGATLQFAGNEHGDELSLLGAAACAYSIWQA